MPAPSPPVYHGYVFLLVEPPTDNADCVCDIMTHVHTALLCVDCCGHHTRDITLAILQASVRDTGCLAAEVVVRGRSLLERKAAFLPEHHSIRHTAQHPATVSTPPTNLNKLTVPERLATEKPNSVKPQQLPVAVASLEKLFVIHRRGRESAWVSKHDHDAAAAAAVPSSSGRRRRNEREGEASGETKS